VKIVEERTSDGSVTLYDFEPTPDRICEDVTRGLTADPKKLPPKYFYDEVGAKLFEDITHLEAYYPTRTETSILRAHAGEIADAMGPRARLVELGSGSGDKTWIILRSLDSPAAYIPIDISRTQLVEFSLKVSEAFPELSVAPVCADYTAELELPPSTGDVGRTVAFFPGSTIGNLEPAEAEQFLHRVRRLVGNGGGLVLGVDLKKDPGVIELAYNDPAGVTARFNLNLLSRINRECGADFDPAAFSHRAVFDQERSRIEMQLVSEFAQTVRLQPDLDSPEYVDIDFRAGEYITTEYSHKYDLADFSRMADRSGWRVRAAWTDPRQWFSVLFLE
jgi:dimethylhistidine N-methyltransferase